MIEGEHACAVALLQFRERRGQQAGEARVRGAEGAVLAVERVVERVRGYTGDEVLVRNEPRRPFSV
jgi:hypothetical protein